MAKKLAYFSAKKAWKMLIRSKSCKIAEIEMKYRVYGIKYRVSVPSLGLESRVSGFLGLVQHY